MVSEEATRRVIKRLTQAGFVAYEAKGSHTKWRHHSGVSVVVPTRHRTISPGVVRQVNTAIEESRKG